MIVLESAWRDRATGGFQSARNNGGRIRNPPYGTKARWVQYSRPGYSFSIRASFAATIA